MKSFLMGVIFLGFYTGALAALPGAPIPTEINIPLLNGGFFLGATGAYLQATGSNGANDFLASINTTTFSTLKNVNIKYNWGWGFNLGYIFPQTANDVNLSYFHFDTNDIGAALAPPGGIIDTNILNIREQIEYSLNQIDLTAGQFINVSCRLRLHPNIGLRWDDIEHKIDIVFTQTNQNPLFPNGVVTASEKNTFAGIGPLAGIDASYYLGLGFGVVSHLDSALVVGNILPKDKATTVNFVSPNTTITIHGDFRADNTQRIIPVTDEKLGIDYTYLFNNTQNSDLTFEVGYQVNNYFNAVDKLTVSGNGVIQKRNTSDMELNGIYAMLLFHV